MNGRLGRSFSGSGPGTQTPDGCSVELYRALPYMGELDAVSSLLRPGATVLELGCGTGRLCRQLQQLGLRVTGVDESAAMLAALPASVDAVQSSIAALALARTFDVVLLASHLINHPDPACRSAFAACARRHLKPGACFLLQRHSPTWLDTVQPGPLGRAGPVALHVEQVQRAGGAVGMKLRYEGLGQIWTQSFWTVALSEERIEALLARAGFADFRWHGAARLWASALAQ